MHLFIELPTFSRYREDYFDDDALLELQGYLLAQPTAGDVVPGTPESAPSQLMMGRVIVINSIVAAIVFVIVAVVMDRVIVPIGDVYPPKLN